MTRRQYITLISSLPHLDHFERAERLPITELRLEQRFAMLEPEDRDQLRRARDLVSWEYQPITRRDEDFARRYRELMASELHPELRRFIEYRLEQRTLMVALRMRRLGQEAPSIAGPWGVGRWARDLPRRWDRPHFGLAAVHPWLPEAQACLEAGDACALERLLLEDIWKTLETLGEGDPFGFPRVVSYYFRWDVVRRWLSYEPEMARTRFRELAAEIVSTDELPRH
ncbi:MAG: DUF2764 family protein [Planctomycetota bacterium]